MKLRQVWPRKLRAALEYLASLKTPLAEKTLKFINQKKVKILSTNQMTDQDKKALIEEQYAEQQAQFSAFYLCKKLHDRINQDWKGRVYEDRIYINPTVKSIHEIAQIIAHEVNHYANDSNNHYETNEEQFTEELRALLAEKLLVRPNLRFTPYFWSSNAKEVIKDYGLKLDESVLTDKLKAKLIRDLS